VKKNIRGSKFFFLKKSHQVKKQTGLPFGLPFGLIFGLAIAIAIALGNAIANAIAITHGYPYA
jgi:hypothetical protein